MLVEPIQELSTTYLPLEEAEVLVVVSYRIIEEYNLMGLFFMRLIRKIFSENPYQKMWDTFVFFESEPTTKEYLHKKYTGNNFTDGFKYAFLNTSKFIYFIKQAKEYFFSAEKSNILVKPLLIYYGMMSLIKALILTKDPTYPNRTGVLRHGITTRKIKKSNYKFHDDEVKIQKEGLLPWFFSIYTQKSSDKIEGNKYKIKELLSLLPELSESYRRLLNEQCIYPLEIKTLESNTLEISVSKNILKFYNGDEKKLLTQLNGYSKKDKLQFKFNGFNPSGLIIITWSSDVVSPLTYTNIFNSPLIIQDIKGNYYLRPLKDTRFLLPDIMIDYMLMYNLGMLCRYETELWGEIIFSFGSEDMYIINELLNLTLRQFPNLVLNDLFDEFLIFEAH